MGFLTGCHPEQQGGHPERSEGYAFPWLAAVLSLALLASCGGRTTTSATPEPHAPEATPAPAGPARRVPPPAPVLAPPVFEIALAPGEGIPVYTAVAERLELRRQPNSAAEIGAVIHVSRGQELTVSETRYQTVKTASIRALKATTVDGRVLGEIRSLSRPQYYSSAYAQTSVRVDSGATFEFLQHRAEGSCFVRIERRVIDAESCPTHDPETFRLTGDATTQLWIRIAEPGRPDGWLQVRDAVVRISDRRF